MHLFKSLPGKLKAGLDFTSFYLIIAFFLAFIFDLVTTYMASPDLKYEGNFFVKFFHLGWIHILIFYSLQTFSLIIFYLLSLYTLHKYYTNAKTTTSFLNEVFHDKYLILSYVGYGYFIKQLSYTIFIVINNYLAYIYLNRIDNCLTQISTWLGIIEIKHNPYFFPVIETIFTILVIAYTIYRWKQIRKTYQSVPAIAQINPE